MSYVRRSVNGSQVHIGTPLPQKGLASCSDAEVSDLMIGVLVNSKLFTQPQIASNLGISLRWLEYRLRGMRRKVRSISGEKVNRAN